MKNILFILFLLFTACQPPAAKTQPGKKTDAGEKNALGVIRADTSQRGVVAVDTARTMKKQDFSPADRTGMTLVYFSKAVCAACAQQEAAWNFAASHAPAGAQMKKVLEHEVDLDWYGITTHPTFILFRDGREIWRYVGIAAAYQLTDAVKRNNY